MKPSALIKYGESDVDYSEDDYIKNRFTAFITFRTAQGTHKTRIQYPLQMVDTVSADELSNIMIRHINRIVHKDIFGRPFNMVKRLKRTK